MVELTAIIEVKSMAKSRQEEGAETKRGVFGVPRGTIESLQFCKNGVVRIAREKRVAGIGAKNRLKG